MKKVLQIIILLLLSSLSYSQTTYLYGTNKVQGSKETGALYSVEIDRDRGYTFVKIEVIPTRKMKRLTYQSSYNTKIKVGNWEAKFLGALSNDGKSFHACDCSDNWGWSNPTVGKKYYYTLVFQGTPPPGSTNFALEDEGSYSGCSGYKFRNYTLKNPNTHPKTYLTKSTIKQKIDEQNDGIVGIYEPFDKAGYTLGCIKEGQTYKLVYLSSGTSRNWWHVGDVKAILRPSSTSGFFKAKWYMADKSINSDAYVVFDGGSMKTVVLGNEDGYIKMYPTNSTSNSISSSTQKSSGTGFALSSNGYIVTNHHVTNGASKIKVRGIKGDFSKTYNAKVIIEDKNNDLAIIKIDDPNFTTLGTLPYKIDSRIIDVGKSVYALGYPLRATMGDEVKLTNGIISSKTGFQGDITTYQITVPVQPGNSGGPLFDSNGNVIGIINAKHTGAENASYAIKTSYLINLIQVMNSSPVLPKTNNISNKGLSDQVKFLKEFVYIIEIN